MVVKFTTATRNEFFVPPKQPCVLIDIEVSISLSLFEGKLYFKQIIGELDVFNLLVCFSLAYRTLN